MNISKLIKLLLIPMLIFAVGIVALVIIGINIFTAVSPGQSYLGLGQHTIEIETPGIYCIYYEYVNTKHKIRNSFDEQFIQQFDIAVQKDGVNVDTFDGSGTYDYSGLTSQRNGIGIIKFTADESGDYLLTINHKQSLNSQDFSFTVGLDMLTVFKKHFVFIAIFSPALVLVVVATTIILLYKNRQLFLKKPKCEVP